VVEVVGKQDLRHGLQIIRSRGSEREPVGQLHATERTLIAP
jgi:hypothetical protein